MPSAVVICLLTLIVVYPWIQTLGSASGADLIAIAAGSSGLRAVLNSIAVSMATVLCAAPLGLGLALVLRYVKVPGLRFARVVASLPLALPPLVGAASFYFLLSEGGVFPRVLQMVFGMDAHAIRLEGFWAVVAIHAHAFFVYFYFFIDDALDTIDRSEIEAATQLGARGWIILSRIALPHLRPALVRASLLVFIASLASFSAPLLFGGGMRFLTTEIYNAKVNGSGSLAATYAMILSAASIPALFVARSRKANAKGTGAPYSRNASRWDPFLALLTWLVLTIIALPPLMLLLLALSTDGSWTTQLLPPSYSFENFTRLFSDGSALQPLGTSAVLAITATVLTALLAGAVVFSTTRTNVPRFFRRVIELFATLPAAIPGTVVGINLLIAFSVPHFFTGGMVLTGTSVVLLLAYVIRTLPFATQGISAGYAGISSSIEEAAASLGAGARRTFSKILLPLLGPAILSSAVFTFVTAFGEFPASTLLFTPMLRPASIEILQHLRLFELGPAAALGVVMIIVSAVAIGVGRGRRAVV